MNQAELNQIYRDHQEHHDRIQSKTLTIKGIGIITIPGRNTKEEVIDIVETLKDDVETLHEMFEIESELVPDPELVEMAPVLEEMDQPNNIFWCLEEECLESIEPLTSESSLQQHMDEHEVDNSPSPSPSPIPSPIPSPSMPIDELMEPLCVLPGINPGHIGNK